jgi:phosphomannomutase
MSAELVSRLTENSEDRAAFLHGLGAEASLDTTDGLRISLEDGGIVHLRPSGNAPELRLYTEAQSPEAAQRLLDQGVLRLQALVGQ